MKLANHIDAKLLLEAVAPRPLAWVTTCSAVDGQPCIAPFSALTLVSTDPPKLLLIVQPSEVGGRKTTAINAEKSGEFVVNLLSHQHLEPLMAAAEPDVICRHRFEVAGIEYISGHIVQVPHVTSAVYAIECRVSRREVIENGIELFFADIVAVHQQESLGKKPPAFLGALGFEWFVSNEGVTHIPQAYLELD